MKVCIVGSGYVGTTVGACLADLGHEVTAIDTDPTVVTAINDGSAPIHEPGLDALIEAHAGDRLTATTDYGAVTDAAVVMLAVPTPSRSDGSIDTAILASAATSVGDAIGPDDAITVIVKSTVIPGTTVNTVRPRIEARTDGHVRVAMNPEFLREGSAVADFQNPDKLVFGTDDARALEDCHALFEPLIADADPPVVETGIPEAEMIKYANNAFLAAKVSLINDIGNICKEFGVDSYEVAEAIGLDHRIEGSFLRSGVGFGGSCFPKDVRAIVAAAREAGYAPEMLEAALSINERQPARLIDRLETHVDLDGARIAVLGLAFKPGTDDTRNSRAIPVISGLRERGATVVAHDPVAGSAMQSQFSDLEVVETAGAALEAADGAVVVTDWPEYAELDGEFHRMATPVVIDGRRIVDPPEDVVYEGLTW